MFTTKDLEVFTHAGYSLLKDGTLYGNFTYQYGDVTSTSSPTLDIINASKAITPDDAFGGLDANQLAYKILANTFILTLGYRHVLLRAPIAGFLTTRRLLHRYGKL